MRNLSGTSTNETYKAGDFYYLYTGNAALISTFDMGIDGNYFTMIGDHEGSDKGF